MLTYNLLAELPLQALKQRKISVMLAPSSPVVFTAVLFHHQ
ncbi:hypothetical protein ACRN9F_19720 [Shewanella oncorhynchi]